MEGVTKNIRTVTAFSQNILYVGQEQKQYKK